MMFAAIETSTILALLGIFVLWLSLKRFGRRPTASSNQHSGSRPASTGPSADGHHLDTPASVARWEVAMHETARDLMGRLDSKIVIVEQLLRDAHQAADRLEAVLLRIQQNTGRAMPPETGAPHKIAADDPSATSRTPVDRADPAET